MFLVVLFLFGDAPLFFLEEKFSKSDKIDKFIFQTFRYAMLPDVYNIYSILKHN